MAPPTSTRSTPAPTRLHRPGDGAGAVGQEAGTIVNNESADILRMLNSGFGALADPAVDLYPAEMRDQIDALNARIYPRLNNGVYRAGFATTQVAYEEAFADVFAMLDELEERFADGRGFLFGERLTEADIRLFVTLVRFDPAYHGLFRATCAASPTIRSQRLPRAHPGHPGRPRNGEHRPHQARLLLDQGAEPDRHRARRAQSFAGLHKHTRARGSGGRGALAPGASKAPENPSRSDVRCAASRVCRMCSSLGTSSICWTMSTMPTAPQILPEASKTGQASVFSPRRSGSARSPTPASGSGRTPRAAGSAS